MGKPKLWRICTAPHASNRCTYTNRNTAPLEQRLDLRYVYDDVGNLTTILDKMNSDQVQTFGYDHLNRLTSAATNAAGGGQYTHTYAYNTLGNLTSYNGAGYTYGSSLHKHAVTAAHGVTFSYDANGNLTFRNAAGSANDHAQNFNVENELASVVNNGSTTTFTYDAAGIRVKTVRPSGKASYFPFPGYEEEVNGSITTRRITYAVAGQSVALRVQVVGGSNTLYYLHSDHLGSTSLATTTSGAVVGGSTARYYPFGDWRTEPTANLTDRGFTGHMHNNLGTGAEDIGLVYMAARWYSPTLGRFISADTIVPNPANPQSLNRYSYVRNSPLNMIDPTGHRECDDPPACEAGGPYKPPPASPPSLGDPLEGFYDIGFDYDPDPTRPAPEEGKPPSYHNGVDLGNDKDTPDDLLAIAVGRVRVADACTVDIILNKIEQVNGLNCMTE
ncbi:MAG: RHS repeat-associated core domain-containing protein [Chloroflexi bacterium]|nr:RHS repeat-associated core domain-containing protein [Chloroflexota bacterium]